jgi:outer membrane protein OmpA-like peptidoglycan-associated protein
MDDSDSDSGDLHAASDGSVSGLHAERPPVRLLVAPTTQAQFNTYQSAIFPIACFKLENVRFDFDSSLLTPDVARETPSLKALIDKLSDTTSGTTPIRPPISIFGHTDPEGKDDYNKILGGRRAAVFYGLLSRRAEVWEDLYSDSEHFAGVNSGDKWGLRSLQIMLNAVLAAPPTAAVDPNADPNDPTTPAADDQDDGNPVDLPIAVDGQGGPQTTAATKKFQTRAKLPASGTADGPTRSALFLAYMDLLCVDGSGQPWHLDPKTDFLGRDEGLESKADFQGCGEFNPIMLFAKDELQRLELEENHPERDARNRQNRRVMALLWRPKTRITPSLWPCPSAKGDMSGCKLRFWSDGDQRRDNGDEQREYKLTQDTFACRFYQRQLTGSPCEAALTVILIRLFDRQANPLPFAPCVVTQPGQDPRPDRATGPDSTPSTTNPTAASTGASGSGDPTQAASPPPAGAADGGYITVRVRTLPATVHVKWNRAEPDENAGSPLPNTTDTFDFQMDVTIDIPDGQDDGPSLTRLQNLGYVYFAAQSDNVLAFQRDYQTQYPDIQVDGTLNAATKDAIQKAHDACTPAVKTAGTRSASGS